MTYWLPHNFSSKRSALKVRSKALKAIRTLFDTQNFDEVQTPALQICPAMDAHLHGFKTTLKQPDLTTAHDLYLHTSPEFAMKKLLVAGLEAIYQIAPVYRNGDASRLHSPEFTLLEWYRTGTDYNAMMQDCTDIIRTAASAAQVDQFHFENKSCNAFADPQKISVAYAFDHYANINLDDCLKDKARFNAALKEKGIRTAADDNWDDLFFRVMAEKIEPHLGQGAPTILYDYPVELASLARRSPNNPNYAERFELYIAGIELANAFSELTDPAEQRTRFQQEMKLKQSLYGETYPVDEDFLAALDHGLPKSSGAALGFDRLIMLLTGQGDIKDVQWLPVITR